MRQVETSRTLVSTRHAGPPRSSRRWWPTTSTSAARELIELIFKRG